MPVFREMIRTRQLLSDADIAAVLNRCTSGVLACAGDDDYPYAVPLSYVYFSQRIYFHSARAGHKIDAITRDAKVSFAVIDEDTIVSAEYTTYFRSVIAFGRARIVDGEERQAAFAALVDKYSGDLPEAARRQALADCDKALIIAIDIEHVTGKEAIEFVKARQG